MLRHPSMVMFLLLLPITGYSQPSPMGLAEAVQAPPAIHQELNDSQLQQLDAHNPQHSDGSVHLCAGKKSCPLDKLLGNNVHGGSYLSEPVVTPMRVADDASWSKRKRRPFPTQLVIPRPFKVGQTWHRKWPVKYVPLKGTPKTDTPQKSVTVQPTVTTQQPTPPKATAPLAVAKKALDPKPPLNNRPNPEPKEILSQETQQPLAKKPPVTPVLEQAPHAAKKLRKKVTEPRMRTTESVAVEEPMTVLSQGLTTSEPIAAPSSTPVLLKTPTPQPYAEPPLTLEDIGLGEAAALLREPSTTAVPSNTREPSTQKPATTAQLTEPTLFGASQSSRQEPTPLTANLEHADFVLNASPDLQLGKLPAPTRQATSQPNTPMERPDYAMQLLTKADAALREHYLSRPSGRNALFYTDMVLDLYAWDNQTRVHALTIIRRIHRAFMLLTEEALDKGQKRRAKGLLNKSRRVFKKYSLRDPDGALQTHMDQLQARL
ncbi:hypothetical protein [Magnetococcus sp. PR-3]|uniref:hypothetical protein n=1 Tax=Magnetococcus sp. PR-3 TaxID=3120355 RepID=UPI002FCE016B